MHDFPITPSTRGFYAAAQLAASPLAVNTGSRACSAMAFCARPVFRHITLLAHQHTSRTSAVEHAARLADRSFSSPARLTRNTAKVAPREQAAHADAGPIAISARLASRRALRRAFCFFAFHGRRRRAASRDGPDAVPGYACKKLAALAAMPRGFRVKIEASFITPDYTDYFRGALRRSAAISTIDKPSLRHCRVGQASTPHIRAQY